MATSSSLALANLLCSKTVLGFVLELEEGVLLRPKAKVGDKTGNTQGEVHVTDGPKEDGEGAEGRGSSHGVVAGLTALLKQV